MKSQEAIQTAQRLAAASKNPEITPAHLLVALLEQEEGLVPAVLNKLGADLPSIKSRARQALADLPTLGEGASADPRPSSALSEVLRRSEGEMAQMGDEYVSTEHMLLAIADRKSPLADLLPDIPGQGVAALPEYAELVPGIGPRRQFGGRDDPVPVGVARDVHNGAYRAVIGQHPLLHGPAQADPGRTHRDRTANCQVSDHDQSSSARENTLIDLVSLARPRPVRH